MEFKYAPLTSFSLAEYAGLGKDGEALRNVTEKKEKIIVTDQVVASTSSGIHHGRVYRSSPALHLL